MLRYYSLTVAAMHRVTFGLLSLCFVLLGLPSNVTLADSLQLNKLRLPPGFQIELLTDAVPNARQMALGRYADGQSVLYVGSMTAGNVYAVELKQDRAAAVHIIASRLTKPVGVAYREGKLYISAVSRMLRLDGIDDRLTNPPQPIVVTDRFPDEAHHGWKFIAFSPDGWLYVPVGAPCNICNPDERYANIQRMKPDGSAMVVVARGVRNSVGFDWRPTDSSLWFTDNGRDMLGDDVPSDELNHVLKPGQHFGYPYCHQGDTPDPEFGAKRKCEEFVAPVVKLGAHVASLGMRFYTGKQFPEAYWNNVFIAEHGSWNRSKKVGYQIVRVVLDNQGRAVRHEPFISGWLQKDATGKELVWGRPADVLVMPDGSMLISDDLAGAIYRVRYSL